MMAVQSLSVPRNSIVQCYLHLIQSGLENMLTKEVVGLLTPEEVAKIAQEELNEDPKRVKDDIKAIQVWLKQQPHLKNSCRSDEKHILAFLRGCKFSLERTKEKLETFYSVRAACPEWFTDWKLDDPTIQDFINLGVNLPLKGYDKHGRRVLLMRGSVIDPSKHTLSDQFKFSFMVSEMLMDELDQSSVTGFVGIQEMSAITMGHMSQFSPALGKKAMTIWQDAYPQRPQGMHFLNLPTIMEGIFNIMKSFAKDKMKERLVVHKKGDLTALHEAVGTDILPEELGGTNGTIQDHIDELRKQMETKQKWFQEQTRFKSDENKRVGLPKTHSDLFGIVGSFRQLAFD